MENYINVSIFFNVLFFGIALLLARGLWKVTERNEEYIVELENSVRFLRVVFKSKNELAKKLQAEVVAFEAKERELKSAFEKSHDTVIIPVFYEMIPQEIDVEKLIEALNKRRNEENQTTPKAEEKAEGKI